jgi:2-amino-4-hydroxy-6-hydroxymethyldihydropteridine diphosphokinase
MHNIFIGMGSNIGDRRGYIQAALEKISKVPSTIVVKRSSVYETEPVGKKNQPDFLNLVAEIDTNLKPEDLLAELKSVEKMLGRTGIERWGPREIDIDILYFGSQIVRADEFEIPHAEVAKRRFVLVPLAEIAPNFKDPLRNKSMADLLNECPDSSRVRKTEIALHLKEH